VICSPWIIFNDGRYLGLLSCRFLICAPRRSRMLRAMAVPSILVAVMLGRLVEKSRAGDWHRARRGRDNIEVAVGGVAPERRGKRRPRAHNDIGACLIVCRPLLWPKESNRPGAEREDFAQLIGFSSIASIGDSSHGRTILDDTVPDPPIFSDAGQRVESRVNYVHLSSGQTTTRSTINCSY
jgi:hypothetical protein